MNTLASSYVLPTDDDPSRSMLAASCSALTQPPPPTLREILNAYKSKGDGDRDLLMAMLNAKSAEDQRLASVAALQRTMLEMQHASSSTSEPAPSSHLPTSTAAYKTHSRYSSYSAPSPPTSAPTPVSSSRSREYRQQPPSPTHLYYTAHQHQPAHRTSAHPYARRTAKRSRTSQSPSRSRSPSAELPPSPYSSPSASPKSRGAMDIGSLISRDELHHTYAGPSKPRPSRTGSYGRERDREREAF